MGFVLGFCWEKARETERGKTHGGKLRKQLIEAQKIDNKVQMKTGYQRKLRRGNNRLGQKSTTG